MASGPGIGAYVRHSSLTLAFLGLTALSPVAHAISGWRVENADRRQQHGRPAEALTAYVASPAFLSSLFDNWESEFLQMGLFVFLTARLRQKGASESRPLEASGESDADPVPFHARPWPVRRGGAWRMAYEHSLSAALLLLFVGSFVLHLLNRWRQHAEDALMHGKVPQTLMGHLVSAQFWFESFQNWRSEFLAVVSLVVLSIFLREKDSTESKDVEAAHSRTGA